MARRLDWDRVRRSVPLEGADPRLDPDGTTLWEREVGAPGERASDAPTVPFPRPEQRTGTRNVRAGIVVRRVRERREDEAMTAPVPSSPRRAPAPPPVSTSASAPTAPRAEASPPQAPLDASAFVECPRCHARIPKKRLLLHARAACVRRGA